MERGATYVDVAPEYGDGVSQARLGPALEGLRCVSRPNMHHLRGLFLVVVRVWPHRCDPEAEVETPRASTETPRTRARERCFLACKTMFRDAAGAQKDLDTSLAALRTDYLDLYQMHRYSPWYWNGPQSRLFLKWN